MDNIKKDFEYFKNENGVVILQDDVVLWFDSIETFLDEELNQWNGMSCKYVSIEDAIEGYLEELKEYLDRNDYQYSETQEEIYIVVSTEEIVINKQDNTVISSFGNYNSINDIVGELLNR